MKYVVFGTPIENLNSNSIVATCSYPFTLVEEGEDFNKDKLTNFSLLISITSHALSTPEIDSLIIGGESLSRVLFGFAFDFIKPHFKNGAQPTWENYQLNIDAPTFRFGYPYDIKKLPKEIIGFDFEV